MISLKTIISDIAKEATRVLVRDSHIFVHPNIPRDKVVGAMSYVDNSVQPNDIVLMLDDTVFGSAKDGLALTETTLFVREKFCEPDQYNFADISSISIRNEFFANVLYIDDVRVAALSQPSKETLIALCLIINTYLKQFQSSTISSQNKHSSKAEYSQSIETGDVLWAFEIDMIMTDILSHFGTFHSSSWTQEKLHILNEISTTYQNRPYLHALWQQRLDTNDRPELDKSIEYLLHHEPPEELKMQLMWQAFQLLTLDEPDLLDAESLVIHFAMLLKIPPAPVNEFCRELRLRLGYGNHQQNSTAQANQSEITWAYEILEVDAHNSTLGHIQQAYRVKIREFHPDKHQSLPPSVRQLVESKAQELNQAREILMAHLQ